MKRIGSVCALLLLASVTTNETFAQVVAAQPNETYGGAAIVQTRPDLEDAANWRQVDPENLLRFTIKRQSVLIELRPDFAPKHVEQIRKIAHDGNYNSLPFHRVIDDFMAQGGEVSAVYMLSTPYPSLQAEFTFRRNPDEQPIVAIPGRSGSSVVGYIDGFVARSQPDGLATLMADKSVEAFALHCAGIASMARTADPNSADTQFFLMRQSQAALDATYTVWGRVLVGLDVVREIKAGPESADGRLSSSAADKLTRAELVADLPDAKRPRVFVQRTEGPEFQQTLAQSNLAVGDPCLLPSPAVHVEEP